MKDFHKILLILAAVCLLVDLVFFPLLPDSVPSKWHNGVVVSEMPKILMLFNMLIGLAMVLGVVLFIGSRSLKGWNQAWFNVYPKPVRNLAFSVSGFLFNKKFDENNFDEFYEFTMIKHIRIIGVMFLVMLAFLQVVIYSEIAFGLGLFGSVGNMLLLSLILLVIACGTYFVFARNYSKFVFLTEN